MSELDEILRDFHDLHHRFSGEDTVDWDNHVKSEIKLAKQQIEAYCNKKVVEARTDELEKTHREIFSDAGVSEDAGIDGYITQRIKELRGEK